MITEVTNDSWFSRIGSSFKGILVGVALVVALIGVLFWNEGRAIKQAKALDEGAETGENMKTILDLIREEGEIKGRDEGRDEGRREGEIKGKIEGKIETIKTVAVLRFQKKSERLTSLLPEFNDLNLLEQIRQFATAATSLFDVEKFADNLLQIQGSAAKQAL